MSSYSRNHSSPPPPFFPSPSSPSPSTNSSNTTIIPIAYPINTPSTPPPRNNPSIPSSSTTKTKSPRSPRSRRTVVHSTATARSSSIDYGSPTSSPPYYPLYRSPTRSSGEEEEEMSSSDQSVRIPLLVSTSPRTLVNRDERSGNDGTWMRRRTTLFGGSSSGKGKTTRWKIIVFVTIATLVGLVLAIRIVLFGVGEGGVLEQYIGGLDTQEGEARIEKIVDEVEGERITKIRVGGRKENEDDTREDFELATKPTFWTNEGKTALGRDGDVVEMEDGTTFVYRNPFGGTFLKSNEDPGLSARAQNDTASLGEEWDWEEMRINGVNLGGWLTVEPFITPHLFEPFLINSSSSSSSSPTNSTKNKMVGLAVDEWTLSERLLEEGGEERLREVLEGHYKTFITEQDFASIAAAGLNWVRIPVPYWAIKKWDDEPFLKKVAWEYLLKALRWSRKYGLRVNLDLHSVPGSQNGWNHSGKLGSINWLHGPMGYANAQRSLDYVAALAEFTSRKEVAEVVKMFSILNEPMMNVIGDEPLRSFYSKAYRLVRLITGYGSDGGPVIAIHDGFKGTRRWFDFPSSPSFLDFALNSSNSNLQYTAQGIRRKRMGGLDRVAIDSHRYLAFTEPDTRSVREQVLKPCQKWAPEFNKTFNGFGIPIAGEFSVAVNDCGRFLNNVNQGTRYEGTFLDETTGLPLYPSNVEEGSCQFWEDYTTWDDELKQSLKDLALAQMDTFQNWFYWTWKTTPSLEHPNRFANPLWSYSLGLEQGWIPSNPRQSKDFCYDYAERVQMKASLPRKRPRKDKPSMEGWKVGRFEADERDRIVPSERSVDRGEYPWPPKYFEIDSLSTQSYDRSQLQVSTLPRYVATGDSVNLPNSSSFSSNSSLSSRPWHTKIEGCDYPDAWSSDTDSRWSIRCVHG